MSELMSEVHDLRRRVREAEARGQTKRRQRSFSPPQQKQALISAPVAAGDDRFFRSRARKGADTRPRQMMPEVTLRQKQIVVLLAHGMSTKEIANHLRISGKKLLALLSHWSRIIDQPNRQGYRPIGRLHRRPLSRRQTGKRRHCSRH